MELLGKEILYTLLSILVALLVCIIAYYKWMFTYWKKRNICTIPPSIPFGNIGDIFLKRKAFCDVMKDIYDEFKSKGVKHAGMFFFSKPVYIPIDPEIVKNILVKDFQHFMNHGGYLNEEVDPLTGHLFTLENEKWRNLRVKLTPTFTSGKMRMMFGTLVDCTHDLKTVMDECTENKAPIDIKDILSRFGTDVIGSCAFGIECDTLKNPDSPFRKYGIMAVKPDFIQNVKNFLQGFLPRSFLSAIKFRLNRKDLEDFFINIVKNTVEYREKNRIYRKDFMHLLLQLKNRGEVSDDGEILGSEKPGMHMTIPEMTAQCYIFFLAGFDTSSTTNTFALYELARNQDIQQKLRDEINTVMKKYDDKLTYDAVKEMTYMDKILQETLRKYGGLPTLMRVCTKEYKIPGEDVTLAEGSQVLIPIVGIHNDPEHYPDPDKFDPERFSEEIKATRHPYTWLPFGEGPRICIGMRFGLMQAKVGLITLVRNYKIFVNKKTIEPIVFDGNSFTLAIKGKMWLDMEKIQP